MSVRGRIVVRLLKLFLKRQIKPDMDVVAMREKFKRLEGWSPDKTDKYKLENENLQDVEASHISNPSQPSSIVILYLHGGGFIWRIQSTYIRFVHTLCKQLNAEAYLPWYRLAPEHVYPAAPEDCFKAYKALLNKGISPGKIIIAGDSAGGNLTLCTLLRIRHAELPLPAGAVLISPVTDLAEQSASWLLNGWSGKDPLFPKHAFSLLDHYCGAHHRCDPMMSPYYADFQQMPPMLFVAGDTESLLEDSIAVAKKAKLVGVPVQVHVWQGMPHVFPVMQFLPEAKQALGDITEFMQACTEGLDHEGLFNASQLIVSKPSAT